MNYADMPTAIAKSNTHLDRIQTVKGGVDKGP